MYVRMYAYVCEEFYALSALQRTDAFLYSFFDLDFHSSLNFFKKNLFVDLRNKMKVICFVVEWENFRYVIL